MPVIDGIPFNQNFFHSYMLKIFAESFTHNSVSFEGSFLKYSEYNVKLREFISKKNVAYAEKLLKGNADEQLKCKALYENVLQVLEVLYDIPKVANIDEETGERCICLGDFLPYVFGAIRPYRNKKELAEAGLPLDKETVLSRTKLLHELISKKFLADYEARKLKKNGLNSFEYALSLKDISISDILEINSLVNGSDVLYRGFKRVNNRINGATFDTCPKEFVPYKMQELMHLYNGEWREEVVAAMSDRHAYNLAVCIREAKFYIQFERIHPFEDGNSRTGRIVLNCHLINNGLAPIIVTPEMKNIYLKSINENDYNGLGEFLCAMSSVTLAQMVSEYRKARRVSPEKIDFLDSSGLKLNKNC